MVNFQTISVKEFLENYWQKKPLVLRQALPGFVNALSPDELAGLALEEEFESRLVLHNDTSPMWHLKRGPFIEHDFSQLPDKNWTLLVQGVDRFIPEITSLLDHFNFIPQWRIDDIMISYAVEQGSVGPHYDNYDVFLYQALGRRKWLLTSQHCIPENYLPNVDLRIMDKFEIEQEFVLEEGDMLYLPAHIGHYGISQSKDCMTYSFGYRSYQAVELWQNLSDFFAETNAQKGLYCDPVWDNLKGSSELTSQAVNQAKNLLISMLNDEQQLQQWFGCFVTQLDQQAEYLLPQPEDEVGYRFEEFIAELKQSTVLSRHPVCRFAYQIPVENSQWSLFINGQAWNIEGVAAELVQLIADNRTISVNALQQYLDEKKNSQFLYQLYLNGWLYCLSD